MRHRDRKTRPPPDDPQLGNSHQHAITDQQVARQRAGDPTEQLRVTDVKNRGEHWLASPPAPPEHDVAVLTAADQYQVAHSDRLRVIAVELQLRSRERTRDYVWISVDLRPARQRRPREIREE